MIGNRLYVGTDVGVFSSPEDDLRWRAIGRDIPQAIVTDLRYVPTNGRLYAATFGQGVWSLKL